MDDEAWMSITIYGPQPEIDRFKRWFVVGEAHPNGVTTHTIDFTGVQNHKGRYDPRVEFHCQRPWGFEDDEDYGHSDLGAYWFKMDGPLGFPTEIFERLGELFPYLMFDCEYIASDRSEAGYGWFNGPKEAEPFVVCEFPHDYWENSFKHFRSREAQVKYESLVSRVRSAAVKASLLASCAEN